MNQVFAYMISTDEKNKTVMHRNIAGLGSLFGILSILFLRRTIWVVTKGVLIQFQSWYCILYEFSTYISKASSIQWWKWQYLLCQWENSRKCEVFSCIKWGFEGIMSHITLNTSKVYNKIIVLNNQTQDYCQMVLG